MHRKVIDKIKNFFIRYIKGNSNKIRGNLKNYIKICQISKKIMDKKRKFSSPLVDGPEQAASRSMLEQLDLKMMTLTDLKLELLLLGLW